MSASSGQQKGSLRWSEVLAEEYASLHPEESPGPVPGKESDRLAAIHKEIEKKKHSALCISGGGIRSATFALGVLQGLASFGWLQKLDYLSTVSGGGYIGSWLTSWIHHHSNGVKGVAGELKVGKADTFRPEPEPKTVQHLRSYSNYLSPKLGLFSADMWTLVATYLRNLLLNWLVFVPLLMAAVMVPRFCYAVIRYKEPPHWVTPLPDWLATPLCWLGDIHDINWVVFAGCALAVISVFFTGISRPRYANRSQMAIIAGCLLPLLGAAACFTMYWAWHSRGDCSVCPHFNYRTMIKLGALLYFLGWGLCALYLVVRKRCRQKRELWSLFLFLLPLLAGGAAMGGMAWFAAVHVFPDPTASREAARSYVCFAVPLFTMLVLMAGTLLMGLASRVNDDEDREWWGRLGAWIMIAMAAWTVVSVLVEFGPQLMNIGLDEAEVKAPAALKWVLSAVGGVSGLFTILVGKSARTPAQSKTDGGAEWKSTLMNKGLLVAAPVFCAIAMIGLSLATSAMIRCTVEFCRDGTCSWLAARSWLCVVAGLIVLLLAFSCFMSVFVNINKFSLHAMYRARLIRAYLGASRADDQTHRPNLFTGFDPNNNFAMCDLCPLKKKEQKQGVNESEMKKPEAQRPFHVINVALNLAASKKLAWQERKAESFTISPLHCGSASLSSEPADPHGLPQGGYRKSADYAKGAGGEPISIGGALTISGAAVSPNMGYHSSPVVAFLLTLFNVRLGAWLGNPGPAGEHCLPRFRKKPYQLAGPRVAFGSIIKEAFGLTDDTSPYVYLSDGGHFENLGLYEMVRRRCRYIIVCDGGADPGYQFEDLVNAIRKCRTDLGIRIKIDIGNVGSHVANTNAKPAHCAIGWVYYDDVDPDAKPGRILYIKASLNGNEPLDVKNYAGKHPLFPHQSTADQFFDESQFESYRALGLHVAREIFREADKCDPQDFDDLFQGLSQCWSCPPCPPPHPAIDVTPQGGAQTSSPI